jgi:hypothetical protein
MPTAHLIANEPVAHHNLHLLHALLQDIYESAASFEPLTPKPPILDTSVEINWDEENQCGQENVPGMRVLREAIKGDLERLESVSPLPIIGSEMCQGCSDFMRPVVSGRSR